jgi:alkylation response protein AidB-like acyl-CoA dehydrogenase
MEKQCVEAAQAVGPILSADTNSLGRQELTARPALDTAQVATETQFAAIGAAAKAGAKSPTDASLLRVATHIAEGAFDHAAGLDVDQAFPNDDVKALATCGLLAAPLTLALGGASLRGCALCSVLQTIGWGSLALGRLFEGHVNAIVLVLRYGAVDQHRVMAREVRQGRLLGVWNTDDSQGLRLLRRKGKCSLEGRKILASGAGHITRPLVTATDEDGRRLMVMPVLGLGERADLSNWTAHGMRASATGAVDFTGVEVTEAEIIGRDGDYERQPTFSGGAWRFAAVQQGAVGRLLDLLREHLRRAGRDKDPHQTARVGQTMIAAETARLWIEQAAVIAEEANGERAPEQIVAYVNLTRIAVERAALDAIELVQRSVGLQGFMRPNPIERTARDLATYLRQPAPDRALASAGEWVLANNASASDLWTPR